MKPAPVSKLEYVLLAALLLSAVALRAWRLDSPTFWVDEAESTINALTILDRGYPTDHYLGIPIYENTLTEPWPESKEYEFKDSSYSDKGVAIYHGWLPLYAIAGSLKAFGIEPDPAPKDFREYTPTVKHDDAHNRRVTVAARAPAVMFGVIFLVLLFIAGREMGGPDVGWAAIVVAALAQRTIGIAREARYYSATVMLGMACCLMVWRMLRRGWWRDFVIGGVVFVLLFHTHTVSFLVAAFAMALALLPWLKDRAVLAKASVTGAIIAAGTVPWALLTGFLASAGSIPKAWPLLKLPDDYLLFPLDRPPTLILIGVGTLALLVVEMMRHRLPARLVEAFAERRAAFYLLGAWVVLGYLAFLFVMPAASFVATRMTLPMLGPGIILAAMIFSSAVHLLLSSATLTAARHRVVGCVATCTLFLGFMIAVKGLARWSVPPTPNMQRHMAAMIDRLGQMQLPPGTRVYATPNRHLILTVYTGIPVQAVAPVRKSFLDTYDGDVVVIEADVLYQPPPLDDVISAAAAAGETIAPRQSIELARRVTYKAVAELTARDFDDVHPRPEQIDLPEYLSALVDDQPAYTKRWVEENQNPLTHCPAIFRGFEMDTASWWPVYFYRFVDPLSRSGRNLNYMDRVSRGKVWVMESGWRIFHSPPRRNVRGELSGAAREFDLP